MKTKQLVKGEDIRVTLAKDVLAHLKAGRLLAKQGGYLRIVTEAAAFNVESLDDSNWSDLDAASRPTERYGSLQEVVHKVITPCEACGVGSCVYAAAMRGLNGSVTYGNAFKALSNYFPNDQLQLMEASYEAVDDIAQGYQDKHYSFSQRERLNKRKEIACKMFTRCGLKGRLERIMKNIIANNGEFVVPSE